LDLGRERSGEGKGRGREQESLLAPFPFLSQLEEDGREGGRGISAT